MNYTERHIVEIYSDLFEGLSSMNKIELIESLTKSLKKERGDRDRKFYKSFGAFASESTAEEIIAEIRSSRKFKIKEIQI
ncbi:MAG TPA: hypothetical protein PLU10_07065 [Chitinophagaceae bacterium]|nr:hypothetical protein [Chitinophagaceae bacterium]